MAWEHCERAVSDDQPCPACGIVHQVIPASFMEHAVSNTTFS